MLKSIIKKNSYKDSVVLMGLSKAVSNVEGMIRFSAMMGTPANKDIFANTGFITADLNNASANDLCILFETEDDEITKNLDKIIDNYFEEQSKSKKSTGINKSYSLHGALKKSPDANLALLSIPGAYVYGTASEALDKGLNVFIFSDNVSIEDELKLKQKASEKKLIVMGPDCGTALLSGTPIAFANEVTKGSIGIVAASGTGAQEVSTIIDRLGGGVSHIIGTGGRDLSSTIEGITAIDGLKVLSMDLESDVIVIISKPPDKKVKDKIQNFLKSIPKPVVALFLGELPEKKIDANIHYAYTLEETAYLAVSLLKSIDKIESFEYSPEVGNIVGLYSGGTLASETAMILQHAAGKKGTKDKEIMLTLDGHTIYDLGDDIYTNGRPHPMIDPTLRLDFLNKMALEKNTKIIIFDVVLGYGSKDDMTDILVEEIEKIKQKLKELNKEVYFVASVCGTSKDPQNYDEEKLKLINAGVIVRDSNASAIKKVISMYKVLNHRLSVANYKDNPLFKDSPKVINIGLESFALDLIKYGLDIVHYEWKPYQISDEMKEVLKKLK